MYLPLSVGRARVKVVLSQGLACFGQAGVTGCGSLVFLHLVFLIGEADPKATAGFLEGRVRDQGILGLVPSHWWVELGLGIWWTGVKSKAG